MTESIELYTVDKDIADHLRIVPSEPQPLRDDSASRQEDISEQEISAISPSLETKFREAFISQSLSRARASYILTLALISWFTFVDILGGLDDGTEVITAIRLGVILPAIGLLLVTSCLPQLRRYYTPITSMGITIAALGIMFVGAWASANGNSSIKLTSVLVLVHATLVLGLRTAISALVASILILGHLVFSILYQVPIDEIVSSTSVLIAASMLCILTISSLEKLLRRSFLETRRLAEQAERDGLTGLFNRRKFDSLINQSWKQAYRAKQCLQILFIDIDHFKYFNDLYGHQAGDECVRRVARTIERAARRPFDFCARYGGEEFALVFYGTIPQVPLTRIAEELREQVMAESIPHEHSEAANVVTVSIGSAIGDPRSGRSLNRLIQKADEALYRAKRSGRNQVVHKNLEPHDSDTGNFNVEGTA